MQSAVAVATEEVSSRERFQGVRLSLSFAFLVALAAVAFFVAVGTGSVLIPPDAVVSVLTGGTVEHATWKPIILELRIPRAVTAALVGGALGVAGLQMQTLFRNGLADPYILGVSSGAALGVGFVILSAGVSATGGLLVGMGTGRNLIVVFAASLGAALVLSVMLVVASWFRNAATVLIVGVAVGAFSYSIVSILIYFSTPESVQAFAVWTFGSFQGVTRAQLPVFTSLVLAGVLVGAVGVKGLNAMLLGDQYAASVGVSVFQLRLATMLSAALIAGVVTAFCGPIGFIGLAVPHMARGLLRTADQRVLFPACILIGSTLACLCGALAQLPGQNATLPINAATALFGAPVVVWVLLRSARESGNTDL
jgi:iron complex transport system permease protein